MARGGKRPGAGRPAGSRNKTTNELRRSLSATAREFTPAALKALKDVASKGQSESARVAAACALLDRGWGRPAQGMDTVPWTALIELQKELAFIVAANVTDDAALDRIEREWSRVVVRT